MTNQPPVPQSKGKIPTVIVILIILLVICILLPCCIFILLSLLGPAVGNVFSDIILGI
jgi:hypothetical protein